MPEQVCEIWNLLDKDYVEEFKGDKVTIPAHGCISKWPNGAAIDPMEAAAFRGQFAGIRKDEAGNDLFQKRLKIRIVGRDEVPIKEVKLECNLCGKKFDIAQELAEHSKTHADRVYSDSRASRK
jgi:hypothetical protein